MAVAHLASAEASTANPTTTGTITIPGSVAAGDFLILAIVSKEHAGEAPPGVTDDDTGGNSWTRDAEASSPDGESNIYWKIATSGSASKTVTWTGAINSSAAVLSAYTGVDGTTPFTDEATEFNNSGNQTQAQITPSQADSMIMFWVFNIDNDIVVSAASCTDPGSLTIREEDLSTGGGDSSVTHASALQAGGPTATGAFTWSQATAGSGRSAAMALKPAAGGGGGDTNARLIGGDLIHPQLFGRLVA